MTTRPSTRTSRIARTICPQPTGLPRLPRRRRVGAAIASGLITAVLFGTVVIGMTSMGEDRTILAGELAAAHRA